MLTKRYKSESARLNTSSRSRKVVGKGYTYRTKMHKTREELNSIFNAITDPIIVFDAEFKVTAINKAAEDFFTGCPIGKKCFFTKHKFALACKNCPTWQTLKNRRYYNQRNLKPQNQYHTSLKNISYL